MKHIEGAFKGKKDLNLFYQGWLAEDNPKAILVVAHGVAEHSGRYAGLAEHLTSSGLDVYSFDYRGHGRSEGMRCFVEHFQDYAEDLHTFFGLVQKLNSGKKIFLLGHSMGAAVALSYAINNQHGLAGLIVSGIPIKPFPHVPWAVVVGIMPLAWLGPKRGFRQLDSSSISRDPKVVLAYDNDPLVFRGKLTTRLTIELLRTAHRLPGQVRQIEIPTLIIHGGMDKISDPEGAKIVYNRIGSAKKELKIYDNLYHEVLNEPERVQVMKDIEIWINRQAQTGPES
jgi:acylglycerol lipase